MAKKTTETLNEAPPPAPTQPEPDWTRECDMRAWFLPYNLGTGVDHVFTIGGAVATGVAVSGIVERITWMPNGTVRVKVRQGKECRYILVKEGHGELL